jgi:single-stranded DNA-binding protein
MNDLNSILIDGVVVGEPQMLTGENEKPWFMCTLKSRRFVKETASITAPASVHEETTYISVHMEGNLASKAAKLIREGDSLRAVGRISSGRWTEADGLPHYFVKVVAEHFEKLRRVRT